MSHWFTKAPSNFSIPQAFRFGEVMGLGGSDKQAKVFASGTFLGEDFSNNDFCRTVIVYFINQAFFDTEQYGPVCDYIAYQKYRPIEQVLDENGGMVELGPPQPDFSMKGRSPLALLEAVEGWHTELGRVIMPGDGQQTWVSCEIPGFTFAEKDQRWHIRELLSAQELANEGNDMRHCVYSYVRGCERGTRAIYSMTLETKAGSREDSPLKSALETRELFKQGNVITSFQIMKTETC